MLHGFMHDLDDRHDFRNRRSDFRGLLVCDVGARYGVDGVRFRHEGGTRIPDAVTALLLALAFLLRLLATFTAIGSTTTTTTTTTAAAFFALRCCRRAIERCVVDRHGGINLRHFLLGGRGLRGLIPFRPVTALLVAALLPSFITATTLLLTFTLLLIFVSCFAALAFRALTALIAARFTTTTSTTTATFTTTT